MSTLQTTLTGYVRYRGREGHYAFILHRLTGLGILLFLIIHIVDTSFVYFLPSLYDKVISIYRSTPFMLGEIVLLFSGIYHGLNGLRIAWFDLFKPEWWSIEAERKSFWWILGISLILWLPGAVIIGYSLLRHNFGLFGG